MNISESTWLLEFTCNPHLHNLNVYQKREVVPPHRPLTLAQAAALLPGPIGVPEELLRFVFYGNVEGVPDIWVEQIAHRKHLRGNRVSQFK